MLIRDEGIVFRNRIDTKEYVECQDDALAVSGMAEDIRDAVIDYQVGGDKADVAVVQPKLRCFDRRSDNGRYMTGIAV